MEETQAFPMDSYMDALVQFLDTLDYDIDTSRQDDTDQIMQSIYLESAENFAKLGAHRKLGASLKRFDAALRTSVTLIVLCYSKVSRKNQLGLTAFYTYIIVLDDDTNDSHERMVSFFDDLVQGNPQKDPWWQLMNVCLSDVLAHYGSFCGFNILRVTLDYYQGNWIERHKFRGFPGAHEFPLYLRRLTGMGQCVGAQLFPTEDFDDRVLLPEITIAVAQIELIVPLVNDLVSFYKEWDEPRDQTSLANNYCKVDGISLEVALDKVAGDTIRCCQQLFTGLEGRNPKMVASLKSFMRGYVLFHLCDQRYRMKEVYAQCRQTPTGVKFCHYMEKAMRAGNFDQSKWVMPASLLRTG